MADQDSCLNCYEGVPVPDLSWWQTHLMGRCVIASVFFGCSLDSETIAVSIGIRDIVGDW